MNPGNPASEAELLRDTRMRTFAAAVLSVAMLVGAVRAGGPVVVVEEPEPVVKEGRASSKGIIPLLMVPLVLCIIFCGPSEDSPDQ